MLLKCIIGTHCDCCWPDGNDCCECGAENGFLDELDFFVGVDKPISVVDDDIEWDDDGTDEDTSE